MKTYAKASELVTTRDGKCPPGYLEVESTLVLGGLQAMISQLRADLAELTAKHRRMAVSSCQAEAGYLRRIAGLDAALAWARDALVHEHGDNPLQWPWPDGGPPPAALIHPSADQPPYWVRAFWSPDRKSLVTAHVTGALRADIIALVDDDGTVWSPAGEQQNMAKP